MPSDIADDAPMSPPKRLRTRAYVSTSSSSSAATIRSGDAPIKVRTPARVYDSSPRVLAHLKEAAIKAKDTMRGGDAPVKVHSLIWHLIGLGTLLSMQDRSKYELTRQRHRIYDFSRGATCRAYHMLKMRSEHALDSASRGEIEKGKTVTQTGPCVNMPDGMVHMPIQHTPDVAWVTSDATRVLHDGIYGPLFMERARDVDSPVAVWRQTQLYTSDTIAKRRRCEEHSGMEMGLERILRFRNILVKTAVTMLHSLHRHIDSRNEFPVMRFGSETLLLTHEHKSQVKSDSDHPLAVLCKSTGEYTVSCPCRLGPCMSCPGNVTVSMILAAVQRGALTIC